MQEEGFIEPERLRAETRHPREDLDDEEDQGEAYGMSLYAFDPAANETGARFGLRSGFSHHRGS